MRLHTTLKNKQSIKHSMLSISQKSDLSILRFFNELPSFATEFISQNYSWKALQEAICSFPHRKAHPPHTRCTYHFWQVFVQHFFKKLSNDTEVPQSPVTVAAVQSHHTGQEVLLCCLTYISSVVI